MTLAELESVVAMLRENPDLRVVGSVSVTSVPLKPESARQARWRAKKREKLRLVAAHPVAPLVLVESIARAKKKPKKPRAPRAPREKWHRVPAEWQPTDEHRKLATVEGVDFERALADFRDHEFKTARKDANATFRVWLRSPFQDRKSGVRPGTAQRRGLGVADMLDRVKRIEEENARKVAAAE